MDRTWLPSVYFLLIVIDISPHGGSGEMGISPRPRDTYLDQSQHRTGLEDMQIRKETYQRCVIGAAKQSHAAGEAGVWGLWLGMRA